MTTKLVLNYSKSTKDLFPLKDVDSPNINRRSTLRRLVKFETHSFTSIVELKQNPWGLPARFFLNDFYFFWDWGTLRDISIFLASCLKLIIFPLIILPLFWISSFLWAEFSSSFFFSFMLLVFMFVPGSTSFWRLASLSFCLSVHYIMKMIETIETIIMRSKINDILPCVVFSSHSFFPFSPPSPSFSGA